MKPERKSLLIVSLGGTLLVVPWELLMTFGFTFTFRAHEPVLTLLFVWFTFLLNIPAVACSWLWPRAAAFWLVGNVVVSVLMSVSQEVLSYMHSAPGEPRSPGTVFTGIFAMIYTAIFFYGPPLLVAAGLLLMPKLTRIDLESRNSS
jgi:hypothetical protein